jgi:hypothetical protein
MEFWHSPAGAPQTLQVKGRARLDIREPSEVAWLSQAFAIYRDVVSDNRRPSLKVLNMVRMRGWGRLAVRCRVVVGGVPVGCAALVIASEGVARLQRCCSSMCMPTLALGFVNGRVSNSGWPIHGRTARAP